MTEAKRTNGATTRLHQEATNTGLLPIGDETMKEQATIPGFASPLEKDGLNGESARIETTIPLCSASGRTEVSNAKRFVMRFGDKVRWCDPWQKWIRWDGMRWKIDDSRHVEKLAKQIGDDLWAQAAQESRQSSGATVNEIWRFAKASNQARALQNLLVLARSDVPVHPSELDTHPWLLNLPDGTFDLKTGELRAHDKADYLTQLCPVPYQPDAVFPHWQGFLRTVLADDRELISYLQRLVGYCLTGSTRDHVLPFLYGVGANGKSTLINTILALLGSDYAIKAPTDLLLAKPDTHPTERADLHGKRFVACVEAEDGRRLAESLVKELTGGDKVRARRMREDFWEFNATHKVWLAANHKPGVRGSDHGIWRRIKLLPFTVTIPNEQQDKELPEKLLTELPGILQWALEGCRQWLDLGLQEPECVRVATGGYREEMDLVGRFLADYCVLGEDLEVAASRLYGAFKEWCEETGEKTLNQTRFGSRLTERGLQRDKVGGKVMRKGLKLREEGG